MPKSFRRMCSAEPCSAAEIEKMLPLPAVHNCMPSAFCLAVSLNSRRGMIQEFLDKPGGLKIIRAEVPLSEMFSYVSTLRGMTKGRAQYTMTFEKYDVVPNQIQEKIVAENKVAA